MPTFLVHELLKVTLGVKTLDCMRNHTNKMPLGYESIRISYTCEYRRRTGRAARCSYTPDVKKGELKQQRKDGRESRASPFHRISDVGRAVTPW